MSRKSWLLTAALSVVTGLMVAISGASASEVKLCAGRAGGGYDGIMRAVGAEL